MTKDARIVLHRGDITALEVDAIVNAANNHLWMGGGVAGAIKRAGGQSIEEEATARGPVAVGEAVVTGGGRLKARHVIHAAVMGQDLQTDGDKIRRATLSSLKRAEELGIESIAFPALGTGVGGFPLRECARIMLEAARSHLKGNTGLKKVVFVLRDEAAYRAFQTVLGEEA